MKNILKLTVLLILMSMVIFSSSMCYARTIDYDKFETRLEELLSSTHTVEIDNKVIKLKSAEDNKYVINYNLLGTPTFTMEMTINDAMYYEEYREEMSKYKYFEYCLKALDSEYSKDVYSQIESYFSSATSALSATDGITKENFGVGEEAINVAKRRLKGIIVDDAISRLSFETLEEKENEIHVKAKFEIKTLSGVTEIMSENKNKAITLSTSTQPENTTTELPDTADGTDAILAVLYTIVGGCAVGIARLAYTLKKDENK